MDKRDLFEELLKEGASLAVDEMSDNTPEDTNDFSDRHMEQMNKLFSRERRRERFKKIGIYTARVASILIIVIAISGLAIYNVDALKTRFMSMFVDNEPDDTTLRFNYGSSYVAGDIAIGYIPDGFNLTKEKDLEYMLFLQFENEDEYFDIDIKDSIDTLSFDTENADVERVEINGQDVFYTEKNDTNILAGYIEDNTVYLMGNVDKNVLYQIFQNITVN